MRDATTTRRWLAPSSIAFGTLFAVASFGAGCGGSDDVGPGEAVDSGVDSTADTAKPPTDSGGDTGGDTAKPDSPTDTADAPDAPLGNGTIGTAKVAANDPTKMTSPFDATPSPDGATIYFTAIGIPDGVGVYSVPAAGGAITKVAAGSPLDAPFGIAISRDGKTLYVADIGTGDGGAIFSIPTAGGAPTKMAGTEGREPRGLEIGVDAAGASSLYFTGIDAGAPAVLKMPVAGGAVTTVAKGAPLADPSGIAVTPSGDVYVLDTVASATHMASVIKVSGGAATEFVANLEVGSPSGIALAQDGSAVLVSGLDPAKSTDSIIRIALADKKQTGFNTGLDKFVEPSGMHRAAGADVYAWVDNLANGGTVFTLSK